MSWLPVTLIFVVLCLIAAFVLCEWLIRRRRARDNDRDSLA